MMKMEFKLTHKDYKDEIYEAEFSINGVSIIAVINMHYHTIRRYWHTAYYLTYGKDFRYRTPNIKACSFMRKRKEARQIAELYILNASSEDIDKLDPFYKKQILAT